MTGCLRTLKRKTKQNMIYENIDNNYIITYNASSFAHTVYLISTSEKLNYQVIYIDVSRLSL